MQVCGRRVRRQLLQRGPPRFCRVIQFGDDHGLPEWADVYWHSTMIKMVPNQSHPSPSALALVENSGSRRTNS
jgi:hypothetical protein